MKHFLIVTSHANKFSELADALGRQGAAEVTTTASLQEVMADLSAATPNLVIIDEEVDGTSGLKIARAILMKNAMVNQAVVSSLSPQEFHDTAEGLGIMAQLPPEPDAAQAKVLLDILEKMP